MNMLRLVEAVNSMPSSVKFPFKKTVLFADETLAVTLKTALVADGVSSVLSGKTVTTVFRDVDDVNVFAVVYFPLLFANSRAEAAQNDATLPRSLKDRIFGVYPKPHTISVENSIAVIIQRLSDAGVEVGDVSPVKPVPVRS